MSLLSITKIRRRLEAHAPGSCRIGKSTMQAAVSVVLRPADEHTEVLFILRAEKEGDPWSGHMAFPGGHHEPDDASLRHTAERETFEEIGLDLADAGAYIGQIDPVRANPRNRKIDMVVTPFVYELRKPSSNFSPNDEVAEVLWGSLNDMHSGVSHTRGEFVVGEQSSIHLGYGVGDEVVWGLTYRMLDQFFALLDPAWVAR